MPLELQVKLLRVLETGMFMRVGSTVAQETDVRVIAATNRPPEQAVASGKLREDLLYRLNVFPIELPPLRDRSEDVPLLAQHFLSAICEREGTTKTFTPTALQRLQAYRWPGNVRELRNVVQRAYVMAAGGTINEEWLPDDPHGANSAYATSLTASSRAAPATAAAPAHAPAASGPAITIPIGTSMADAERQLILATLEHFNQQKERTAAALGVSLKTLYNRLKEYAADKVDVAPE
jgi:DNA-binding NtrC family response regulator